MQRRKNRIIYRMNWQSHNGIAHFIAENIHSVIQDEIGKVFVKVLECAGVYKRTTEGQRAFQRFLDVL